MKSLTVVCTQHNDFVGQVGMSDVSVIMLVHFTRQTHMYMSPQCYQQRLRRGGLQGQCLLQLM